jgi:serine/threonine protein kinase
LATLSARRSKSRTPLFSHSYDLTRGEYTHLQFLGLLLHLPAVCNLHSLFKDVGAWSTLGNHGYSHAAQLETLDIGPKDRLEALGYNFPSSYSESNAWPVYSWIGCLVSAITYLHEQKICHKDLKTSNTLLSRGRLWLSDFGSATDFSLLSQSATDNERGTPRYSSPEVRRFTISHTNIGMVD